jgi:predicted transcriptional regulator
MENVMQSQDVAHQRRLDSGPASGLWHLGKHCELTIRDIMSTEVITAASSDTICSVAIKMSQNNVSCVVVLDDDRLTGIITEKDVLQAVASQDTDFRLQNVSDRMSSPIQVISPARSVIEAGQIMEAKGVRRLPVAEGDKLVGIVTQTDITRGLISLTPLRYVADIMSRDITTVDAQTTVAEAARIMSSRHISCVLVLHRNELAGILTEKDLLKRVVALSKNATQTRVAAVMSCPVTSAPPGCSILSASKMMEKMHIHRLVITDGREVCGIVTQTDVMRAVRSELEKREQEQLELTAQLDDLPH